MKAYKLLFLSFLFSTLSYAQVGVNIPDGQTVDASAAFEVKSTTKGMLTPRMATAQRLAIVTPTNGLLVFDTDLKAFYYYDSTTSTWIRMSDDDAWINATGKVLLGTKSNGTPRDSGTDFVALDNGNVGIGAATPESRLTVQGGQLLVKAATIPDLVRIEVGENTIGYGNRFEDRGIQFYSNSTASANQGLTGRITSGDAFLTDGNTNGNRYIGFQVGKSSLATDTKLMYLTDVNGGKVGVNTEAPAATLEVAGKSAIATVPDGIIAPRLTGNELAAKNGVYLAAQTGALVYVTAAASPAIGKTINVTTAGYYYYDHAGLTWIRVNSNVNVNGRTNFKRIKATDVLATVLAAEKSAGGNTKYLLNTNTLYEINGSVTFDLPIDLNNAYIQGIDSGDDKIIKTTGNIFEGATGGTIKGLTITATGGNVFALTGTAAQNLIFRDCIVVGSASVGTISDFGLVFLSIVQFAGNTNGITYSNISQLLLSNLGWFGNNAGTFEKLTGTFGLVQKQGGFSAVNGTASGLDVSDNTLAVTTGVLESVAFTGTNTAGYIKPYAAASTYTGFNFSNVWYVDSPGIPKEGDAEATGDINLDAAVGSGAQTSFTGTTGSATRTKLLGTTTSNSLFRFTKEANNRITYRGNKTRYFQIAGSVSYQGGADFTVILYIAKNGIVLTDTKVYGRGTTGFLTTQGIIALPIVGTVQLKKDDFIEIWAERYDGSGNMQTVSLNLTAR